MPGESGPVEISLPKAMTVAAFFGMSIYNSIEILCSMFYRFKNRQGLYFWSMLVACVGIPVHSIAVLLRNFGLAPNVAMCFVIVFGWWAMVTGQSVVLYSRLHLVSNRKNTRAVLAMIITNFVILHLPVSALYLAINIRTMDKLNHAFHVYESVQLTGFAIQECTISGLYIWEASRSLGPILKFRGSRGKHVVRHLIFVNILVVAIDISLLVTNNFEIQTTYKPVVYSIKLKLEFFILNQLIRVIQSPACMCNSSFIPIDRNTDAPCTRSRSFHSGLSLRKGHKSETTVEAILRLPSAFPSPTLLRKGDLENEEITHLEYPATSPTRHML